MSKNPWKKPAQKAPRRPQEPEVRFTVRTYYNNETQAVHRAREARIYKDKLGDWAVMTGNVKGEDSTTKEPAAN